MFSAMRITAVVCLGAAFAASAIPVGAQEFPTKPIRLIVPNTAGTLTDAIVRVLGPELSKQLGQPIVIENKPGAGNVIGLDYVARQVPADGYTIVISSTSSTAMLPVTVKELRFDPLKDLPPFIGLVEGRLFLGTSSLAPWKTFQELVANAKANPGKLNYGSPAPNTLLMTEALLRGLGLTVTHVPYSAGGPYYTALASGEVHMGFVNETITNSMAGKLRVLAVTGDQRHAQYPDIPTLGELGFPSLRSLGFSLNAPAATPKAVFDRLHAAAAQALRQPEVKAQYAKLRLDIIAQSPEAALKSLLDDARLFAGIARQVGLKPE